MQQLKKIRKQKKNKKRETITYVDTLETQIHLLATALRMATELFLNATITKIEMLILLLTPISPLLFFLHYMLGLVLC